MPGHLQTRTLDIPLFPWCLAADIYGNRIHNIFYLIGYLKDMIIIYIFYLFIIFKFVNWKNPTSKTTSP